MKKYIADILFYFYLIYIGSFGILACNMPPKHMSLLEAAAHGNLAILKQNINANVDMNIKDHNGYTPLMIATYHNNYNIVYHLLKEGANIDIQGNDGRTALILATCNMNTKIIKILLQYHPNKNIEDNSGFTALDHANNLNLKTISALLENK